jgi:spore coat polysaccharide biosynthesis protein SpsF
MVRHLADSLRRAESIDQVVLATTVNRSDDVLEKEARALGIGCFRGSEEDVLTRVIGAAESAGADLIVEITGDCPIIDPGLVEQTVQMFLHNDCDYAKRPRPQPSRRHDCQVRRDPEEVRVDDPGSPDHEHVAAHRNHPELSDLPGGAGPARAGLVLTTQTTTSPRKSSSTSAR